ncbi:hypothetical protein CR983_03800 [Candidatus Saccharibacteria bacterium]|nr:MAG: hypothetical protein CR983_03800 [Candidatus Saccharibacteria bacterium]
MLQTILQLLVIITLGAAMCTAPSAHATELSPDSVHLTPAASTTVPRRATTLPSSGPDTAVISNAAFVGALTYIVLAYRQRSKQRTYHNH